MRHRSTWPRACFDPVVRNISSILVPVDFCEPSIRALDAAIELARTLRARVVACHVCHVSALIASILGSRDDLAAAIAAGAQSELDDIARVRADRGVEIVPLVRREESAKTIQAIAEEIGAALVFDPDGHLTGRGIKHRWYTSPRSKLEGGTGSDEPLT